MPTSHTPAFARRMLLLTTVLAAAGCAGPRMLAAQGSPSRESEALNAVLRYRLYWLADSTVFDACRVYTVLNRPATLGPMIETPFRRLVNAEKPCDEPVRAVRDLVLLKSITVDKIAATVSLSIQHGDYIHDETYHLLGPPWLVDSVVIRGAVTITRPPGPQ